MQHVNTLIVGAGPTGLGAAWRLTEQGRTDWLIVEAADVPGGAAASVVDHHGFVWDLGGHVIHSHFPYFDAVLASSDIEWEFPKRAGYVFLNGDFIPVPLQQNLASLPAATFARIRSELSTAPPAQAASNLAEWFAVSFGATLTAEFFAPFNTKMWAHAPELLDHRWTALRSGSALSNVPPASMGEGVQDRSRFPYPRHGSGSLWSAVAAQLPPGHLRFGARVLEIDADRHQATLDSGVVLSYGQLVSSMPLTHLLRQVPTAGRSEQLRHSSVEVIGFGFAGPAPEALRERSWVYHPDPAVPFHRATVLSNYSPAMAGAGRWSILLECATSAQRQLSARSLAAACLPVLQSWGAGVPISTWERHVPLGYPVPTLGRDEALEPILAHLERLDIRSRGRFGGWRYESCNQDYAFMQGVQAVDGGPEDAFWPERRALSVCR